MDFRCFIKDHGIIYFNHPTIEMKILIIEVKLCVGIMVVIYNKRAFKDLEISYLE